MRTWSRICPRILIIRLRRWSCYVLTSTASAHTLWELLLRDHSSWICEFLPSPPLQIQLQGVASAPERIKPKQLRKLFTIWIYIPPLLLYYCSYTVCSVRSFKSMDHVHSRTMRWIVSSASLIACSLGRHYVLQHYIQFIVWTSLLHLQLRSICNQNWNISSIACVPFIPPTGA